LFISLCNVDLTISRQNELFKHLKMIGFKYQPVNESQAIISTDM